jgi:hypothetical protein
MGRFWPRHDRKRQWEREQQHKAELNARRSQWQQRLANAQPTQIVKMSHRKMQAQREHQVFRVPKLHSLSPKLNLQICDRFVTIQELLAATNRADTVVRTPYAKILSVTTV